MRVTLAELAALALIVLAGFAVRAAYPERISVEHFDEGVYAADWFCHSPGLPDGKYPRQHLYAPPLLPELCFWTVYFSGRDPHAVAWINIIAGTLTIPLLWRLGRSWFGPSSGLLAAALCAFSDVHIAFSRMVLTDVLMCLFLIAGVGAGVRALQTGRALWIISAGVLAALAWWTKYNGWLTLAITGAGMAGWIVFDRTRDVPATSLLFRWSATAAIAFALWSPVLWGLQDVGGYSAVAANHSKYFVGLADWGNSLSSQLAKLEHFDSGLGIGLSACSVSIVVLMAIGVTIPKLPLKARLFGALMLSSAFLLLLSNLRGVFGFCLFFGMLSLLVLPRNVLRPLLGRVPVAIPSFPLAFWILLAWLAGLFLAVPLYSPYPRLALPLACIAWLTAAPLFQAHRSRDDTCAEPTGWKDAVSGLILAAVMGMAIIGVRQLRPDHWLPEVSWQDRRGLESIAPPLVDAAEASFAAQPARGRQELKAALYVFAEPALFYHLAALPRRTAFRYLPQPIGDHALLTAGPPDPYLATFLIAGPHADANAADAAQFAAAVANGRLTLVQSFPYTPSDLVLLDQTSPQGLPGARSQSIRLYRLRE